jgi:glycosyltransferase involved in cell wall biosynthesis
MVVKEKFLVSVIMPVFNAGKYVERAVESVIHLPNTGELILIDDCSQDNSLEICKEIESKYANIQLLKHKDGKNHGAAASRNLGILKAKYLYISFLDADDYYLENRFDLESQIFEQFPDVDGVYGFTLAKFESERAKEMFADGNINEKTTFSVIVAPENLFRALILGGYGCFHTSGITVKKTLIEETGGFNLNIRYVEDTELWFKLSLIGKIVSGSIFEPVAMRWVHENNSIHESENIKPFRKLMYNDIFNWALKRPFTFEVKNIFFMAMHRHTNEYRNSPIKLLFRVVRKTPGIIVSSFFIKKLHLILLKN